MKHALAGIALFAAGAALGSWLTGARGAPETAPAAPTTAPPAAAPAASGGGRFALQAWEGCRPLEAGGEIRGPTTRSLSLSDGRRLQVALVPVRRDDGTPVFDTLVKYAGGGGSRSQLGAESLLLTDGVLLRASDLDGVDREVRGPAAYIHAPHPMAE